MDTKLSEAIRRGEIDVNNQSLFFSILTKGLLQQLKHDIQVRKVDVPHFILNTGDDTMYLSVKGQDQSKEPKEVTNENYVYNIKPRCIVEPKGISLIPDQLTSPYARGSFQLDYNNEITTFSAEFRRYPLTMNFDLSYYLDSYSDALELIQQVITKLAFIRTFSISYMGQHIKCSYVIPEAMDTEYNIQIEGDTKDSKDRKINLSLTVETYIPVYDVRTVVQADHFVAKPEFGIFAENKLIASTPAHSASLRDRTIEILERKIEEYNIKDRNLTVLLKEILAKINEKALYE